MPHHSFFVLPPFLPVCLMHVLALTCTATYPCTQTKASNSMSSAPSAYSSAYSSEYIRTTTNYISRKALIEGPQYVEMRGRSIVEENVTIRGDLAPIRVGHYCFFAAGSVLSPGFITVPPKDEPRQQQQQLPTPPSPQPPQQQQSKQRYIPLTIGSMTYVGPDAVIQAASIGSHVEIGANCVVSPRCLLKDCCRLAPGTVLPPDSVVPPFALMSGVPAKMVGELPPSVVGRRKEEAQGRYRRRKRWIVGGGNSGSSSKR